ncbi:hypothetical protein [Myceligenerans xiligouense]|uniref:A-factor biosynthesis hotdog protein n=1 Tax=Myceligenerans xiligouense TaxID=253184 RepID=A0A3N4YM77_9MICO|nr:hypothetical protein [Myceligenerans xiligouense]RPF21227.1 hypothetical protein EDD34_1850 [Myceligenerans xiligouense]
MPTSTNTTATYDDIAPLICVTRPYYALENLHSSAPGRATAVIPVQAPPGRQTQVIGVGEVGRHLAALGLSAAATSSPAAGRHFYLAHRTVGRMYPAGESPAPGPLIGTAVVQGQNRRQVVAHTELRDSAGTLIARMDVQYKVMTAGVFHRLMGPPTETDADSPENPYVAPMPVRDVSVHGPYGSAKLEVRADMCRGHFDGFPALPVSMASYASFEVFHRVLDLAAGPDSRWRCGAFRLKAEHLAMAGQTCTVEIEPAKPRLASRAFSGTVRTAEQRKAVRVWVDYDVV